MVYKSKKNFFEYNSYKKHPLKESSFRGCKHFYLLALVLLQGTLKHIKKRQAHFTVIES